MTKAVEAIEESLARNPAIGSPVNVFEWRDAKLRTRAPKLSMRTEQPPVESRLERRERIEQSRPIDRIVDGRQRGDLRRGLNSYRRGLSRLYAVVVGALGIDSRSAGAASATGATAAVSAALRGAAAAT